MPKILAITEAMHGSAKNVLAKAGEIQSSHGEMERIAGGMTPYFSGTLPELLTQRLLDMKKKHAALYEKVSQYSEKVDYAADNYDWSDQEIAGWANRLGVSAAVLAGSVASSEVGNGSYDKSTLRWDSIQNQEMEVDSFNGVPAYINEQNFNAAKSGNYYDVGFQNGERNCAEYVKRYYSTLYGMNVTGLVPGGNPSGLISTAEPKPGDVINTVVDGVSHWAIVKEIKDGRATVIEQNTVYKQGDGYAMSVNNFYSVSGNRFFTLPS
jgi:hypothetical protein